HTASADIYSLPLHDALPILSLSLKAKWRPDVDALEVCRQHGREIAYQWALAPLPEMNTASAAAKEACACAAAAAADLGPSMQCRDRKSTRLNSSHVKISYAV